VCAGAPVCYAQTVMEHAAGPWGQVQRLEGDLVLSRETAAGPDCLFIVYRCTLGLTVCL